jgi:hypothetical protein
MTRGRRLSRRKTLAIGAAAAALPLVHVRSARSAAPLSLALLSGFILEQDAAMKALVEQWARDNKTPVRADFITVLGNKFLLTLAAEAHAGVGHDVILPFAFNLATYAEQLEPMDDVVARLAAKYGKIAPFADYFAKLDGSYRAVPASFQSNGWPGESRIDLLKQHAGIDLRAVFPVADAMGPAYAEWTWDAFLPAAEAWAKAGVPFGLPMGKTTDTTFWVGALFSSFGAELVNAEGQITANSDTVRAALEYMRRLMPFLPPDVYSWDNASNNRALISGRSALIFNPPSAWIAALQHNPAVAEQIWHHPLPAGPRGRYTPFAPAFWGIWKFSRNKTAARELIEWLSQREQVERLCAASRGYDIPPFISMTDFPVWAEEGPPKGTVYHYPIRPQHHAEPSVPGWPAPPRIANQITASAVMPKMIARVTQSGMSIAQSIALAEQELEGFMR